MPTGGWCRITGAEDAIQHTFLDASVLAKKDIVVFYLIPSQSRMCGGSSCSWPVL